jgi:hypothetical protein
MIALSTIMSSRLYFYHLHNTFYLQVYVFVMSIRIRLVLVVKTLILVNRILLMIVFTLNFHKIMKFWMIIYIKR